MTNIFNYLHDIFLKVTSNTLLKKHVYIFVLYLFEFLTKSTLGSSVAKEGYSSGYSYCPEAGAKEYAKKTVYFKLCKDLSNFIYNTTLTLLFIFTVLFSILLFVEFFYNFFLIIDGFISKSGYDVKKLVDLNFEKILYYSIVLGFIGFIFNGLSHYLDFARDIIFIKNCQYRYKVKLFTFFNNIEYLDITQEKLTPRDQLIFNDLVLLAKDYTETQNNIFFQETIKEQNEFINIFYDISLHYNQYEIDHLKFKKIMLESGKDYSAYSTIFHNYTKISYKKEYFIYHVKNTSIDFLHKKFEIYYEKNITHEHVETYSNKINQSNAECFVFITSEIKSPIFVHILGDDLLIEIKDKIVSSKYDLIQNSFLINKIMANLYKNYISTEELKIIEEKKMLTKSIKNMKQKTSSTIKI